MSSISPYHEGELAVQELAGERLIADRNAAAISSSIMPGALKFIARQPMLIIASIDETGRVWTSMITGPRGFATAADPRTVHISATVARSHELDPLWNNLAHNSRVGILVFEPSTRRRLRLNGEMTRSSDDAYRLDVIEAYPNCPKYIQRRELFDPIDPHDLDAHDRGASEGQRLGPAQARFIAKADTFFIGSAHPLRGVDVSHRGGETGFVRLLSDQRLRVPDYSGNGMFNTLGNFRVNPRAGALFVDFEQQRVLQITGDAVIHFDLAEDPRQPTGGTRRYWELLITEWIDAPLTSPLRTEYLASENGTGTFS